eukprot:11410082-Alexandrium_andersonii.AAC.1
MQSPEKLRGPDLRNARDKLQDLAGARARGQIVFQLLSHVCPDAEASEVVMKVLALLSQER